MPGEEDAGKKMGGVAHNIQKLQKAQRNQEKVKKDGTTKDERRFLAAAAKGDVATVKKAIQRSDDIVWTKDQFTGYSGLHFAVATNNVDLVNLLLQAQHPVNVTNRSGTTPLHLAGARGYTGLIEILLKAGADKDARDHAGFTYLQLARLRSPPNRPKEGKPAPGSPPLAGRATGSLKERGRSGSTREPTGSPKIPRSPAPPRSPTKLGPGK
eukprot:comp23181_c0_seq1/m.37566 comp23181_c0_seq1/g.37566  ORF comp23181_c0_seq1/g.37566 comp23181_c0_seq1/m.37566 type:complete len:212 (-) comp23181_c0_seq1:613-1248(-)